MWGNVGRRNTVLVNGFGVEGCGTAGCQAKHEGGEGQCCVTVLGGEVGGGSGVALEDQERVEKRIGAEKCAGGVGCDPAGDAGADNGSGGPGGSRDGRNDMGKKSLWRCERRKKNSTVPEVFRAELKEEEGVRCAGVEGFFEGVASEAEGGSGVRRVAEEEQESARRTIEKKSRQDGADCGSAGGGVHCGPAVGIGCGAGGDAGRVSGSSRKEKKKRRRYECFEKRCRELEERKEGGGEWIGESAGETRRDQGSAETGQEREGKGVAESANEKRGGWVGEQVNVVDAENGQVEKGSESLGDRGGAADKKKENLRTKSAWDRRTQGSSPRADVQVVDAKKMEGPWDDMCDVDDRGDVAAEIGAANREKKEARNSGQLDEKGTPSPWADMCEASEREDGGCQFGVALGEARCGFLRNTQAGWGVCAVCSLKDKRNRYGHVTEHFETAAHTAAVAWVARKVDERVEAVVPERREVGDGRGSTSDVVIFEGGERIEVFLPESCAAGEAIDGVFLIDSFYYMKASRKKKDYYLPRVLAQIRRETGLTFMAVCAGGAVLFSRGRKEVEFSQLMERVPDNVSAVIAIVCGNDWYAQQNVRSLDAAVKTSGATLCEAMKAKSLHQLAIVGMSAATWKYDAWMSEKDVCQYDANAADLVAHFMDCGVMAVRGDDALRDICVKDGIGHVSVDSEDIVFDAYAWWVQLCLSRQGADMTDGPFETPSNVRVQSPVTVRVMSFSGFLLDVALCRQSDAEDIMSMKAIVAEALASFPDRVTLLCRDVEVDARVLSELCEGSSEDRWVSAVVRHAPDVQPPWRAVWDEGAARFYYWGMEGGETTWDTPPLVPESWACRWSAEHKCFWFANTSSGARTWEQPPCDSVPAPWVLLDWDEEEGAFVYLNEQLDGPGRRITRRPTVEPPVFDGVSVARDADGRWVYFDTSTGERCEQQLCPNSVLGWTVDWCVMDSDGAILGLVRRNHRAEVVRCSKCSRSRRRGLGAPRDD